MSFLNPSGVRIIISRRSIRVMYVVVSAVPPLAIGNVVTVPISPGQPCWLWPLPFTICRKEWLWESCLQDSESRVTNISLASAIAVALGIAIQNVPGLPSLNDSAHPGFNWNIVWYYVNDEGNVYPVVNYAVVKQ